MELKCGMIHLQALFLPECPDDCTTNVGGNKNSCSRQCTVRCSATQDSCSFSCAADNIPRLIQPGGFVTEIQESIFCGSVPNKVTNVGCQSNGGNGGTCDLLTFKSPLTPMSSEECNDLAGFVAECSCRLCGQDSGTCTKQWCNCNEVKNVSSLTINTEMPIIPKVTTVQTPNKNVIADDNPFPVAAVAGGAAALVFAILICSIVIFIVRRRKPRKKTPGQSANGHTRGVQMRNAQNGSSFPCQEDWRINNTDTENAYESINLGPRIDTHGNTAADAMLDTSNTESKQSHSQNNLAGSEYEHYVDIDKQRAPHDQQRALSDQQKKPSDKDTRDVSSSTDNYYILERVPLVHQHSQLNGTCIDYRDDDEGYLKPVESATNATDQDIRHHPCNTVAYEPEVDSDKKVFPGSCRLNLDNYYLLEPLDSAEVGSDSVDDVEGQETPEKQDDDEEYL